MSLIDAYLEQIELCSSSINDLSFQPPKQFTNALLEVDDITSLIRDTEQHEKALFTLAPPTAPSGSQFRRKDDKGNITSTFKAPRRDTAVAAVLGGELAERIRREQRGHDRALDRNKSHGTSDVDVGLLLHGAQKICAAYPIPGAIEKIDALRSRFEAASKSVAHYEALVAEQTTQLRKLNRSAGPVFDEEEGDETALPKLRSLTPSARALSPEDLQREEEKIRELERKKQSLQERVDGMEKDLGEILK